MRPHRTDCYGRNLLIWIPFKAALGASVVFSMASCLKLSSSPQPKPAAPRSVSETEGKDICAGSSFRSIANPDIIIQGTAVCHLAFKDQPIVVPIPEVSPEAEIEESIVVPPYHKCEQTDVISSFIISRTDDLPVLSLYATESDARLQSYKRYSNYYDTYWSSFRNSLTDNETSPTYFGVAHSQMVRLTTTSDDLMDRFCVHTVKETVTAVKALDVPQTIYGKATPFKYQKIKRLAFAASTGDVTQGARSCHELAVARFAGSSGWSMIGGLKPVIADHWNNSLDSTVVRINDDYVAAIYKKLDISSFGDSEDRTISTTSYLNSIRLKADQSFLLPSRLKFLFAGSGSLGGQMQQPQFMKSSNLSCAGLNQPNDEIPLSYQCSEDEIRFPKSVELNPSRSDDVVKQWYGLKMGVLCADFE